MSTVRRPTIVNVVNFPLPAGDYRVDYARMRAEHLRVMFVIPVTPAGIPDDDVVLLPFGEGVQARDALTYFRLLAFLLRSRAHIDLVHFYSTKHILIGPLLAATARIPCVVTVTGFGRVFSSEGLRHRAARAVYWALFRMATRLSKRVLFQNTADLSTTVARLPRLAAKSHYVGSATASVAPQQRDRGSGALRVVHVARLLPSKGVEDFVRVAGALRDDPVEFVLVGGRSDDYPATAELVERAAREQWLRYLGRLDSTAVAQVYDDADVVFFPSYGEGMARVMLEAGMRGLCPVAYDIPANRDLVVPGRGHLLPLGDTAGAVDVLRRLAVDRDRLDADAAAYREHVQANFSMAAFAERLDEVVRPLLEASATEARP